MQLKSWLLFLYKVPHEPSSRRVYVWRKLRRLGAILLYDAAWALPKTTRSQEKLRQLADEVRQLGGSSLLWEANLTSEAEDNMLLQTFTSVREHTYNSPGDTGQTR